MKASNYLHLEYQRTLRLFRKLQTRFEKRIANKTIDKLTAKKRYQLVKKLEKLKARLSALVSRMQLAGIAGAMGLASLTFNADAQTATGAEKTVTSNRELVNTTTVGDQDNPGVAMNEAGDKIVVWRESGNLYGRKYYGDGTVSDEFQIFDSPDGTFRANYVAADIDENGDFVVAYEQYDYFDSYNYTIQMERFDGETLVAEDPVEVVDLGAGDGSAVDRLTVGIQPDGDVMIAYRDYYYNDITFENIREVRAAFIEGANTPIITRLSVDTESGTSDPTMALDDDGNGIIVWSEEYYDNVYYTTVYNLNYRKFDSDGSFSGSSETLLFGSGGDANDSYRDPHVDINNDGDFIVGRYNYSFPFRTAEASVFDSDGNLKFDVFSGSPFSNSYEGMPQVAANNLGEFFVNYQTQTGGRQTLHTNRYNPNGTLIEQFPTFGDTTTDKDLSLASVDINDQGDFVVVWADDNDALAASGTDQSGMAVYMTIYEDAVQDPYTVLNEEPIAELGTQDFANDPSIASDADGNYVIVWYERYDYGGDYDYFSIKGQHYNSAGKEVGAEFEVYDNSSAQITGLDVDMNADGDFVVAWLDPYGVWKKAYNTGDNSVYQANPQHNAQDLSVSIDATGDFTVVAWADQTSDIVYANFGTDFTSNITINDPSAVIDDAVGTASVAVGVDDNFVVVWDSNIDPDDPASRLSLDHTIYSRRFDGSSPLDASAQVVARYDESDGSYGFEHPRVDANKSDGDYAIVFEDKYQYSSYLRKYDAAGTPDGEMENLAEEYPMYGGSSNPKVDMNEEGELTVLWYGYGYANHAKKFDASGNIIISETQVSSTYTSRKDIAVGRDALIATVENSPQVYQTYVAAPTDFDFTGNDEEIVNTETSGDQTEPKIASNSNGDFVVVWYDRYEALSQEIKAQVYNSSNEKVGGEIVINNSPGSDTMYGFEVAMNEDGNFMVIWKPTGTSSLRAQVTDLTGAVIRDDFEPAALGSQEVVEFDIAMDQSGEFTVVWTEDYISTQYFSNFFVRKFDGTGDAGGVNETPIFSTMDDNNVVDVSIAINLDGDLAVAYANYYGNAEIYDVKVRTFDAALSPVAGVQEVTVGALDMGEGAFRDAIDVVADDNGDFVIANSIYQTNNYDHAIALNKYVAGQTEVEAGTTCVAIGSEVNLINPGQGDMILVYNRSLESRDFSDIYTLRVDENFLPIGSEYQLNSVIADDAEYPRVVTKADGVFLATWEADRFDGDVETVALKEFYSYVPQLSSILPAFILVDEGGDLDVSLPEQYIVNNSSLEPVLFDITDIPDNGTLEYDLGEPMTVNQGDQLTVEQMGALLYSHDGSEEHMDSFSFILDNGTFRSEEYTLDITVNPVNDDTELTANNGMTVDEGGSSSFYETLATNDPDNNDDEITFTITSLPSYGTLWNVEDTEFELGVNDTFTQADVGSAYVEYRHDGGEESTDSFEFTFGDLEFTSTTQTFDIDVSPVNDDPTLDVNAVLNTDEGTESAIDDAHLEASDVDNIEIVYTVTSVPTFGDLNLNGTALGVSDTFAQSDIANGDLTYAHDGTEDSATDSFGFDISDGSGGDLSGFTFDITISFTNDDPTVDNPISDQTATEDIAFNFTLPSDVFADEETSALSLTATQTDGSDLPAWLSFDGTDFTGTPLQGDGDIDVRVTAEDEGGLTTFDDFTITVTPVNDAPSLDAEIADQGATEDIAFSFTVPAGTFSDEETSSLSLTATQTDGSDLPAWLSFDGADFTGTPLQGDGDIDVRVTAEDEGGLTVFDDFTITVTPVNDAPSLDAAIADQSATEDEAFSFTVPAGTFSDEETSALSLTASQTDGSALPTWLTFDGADFTGTPLHNDTDVDVRVTAEDEEGLTVSDEFSIAVTQVNDSPELVSGIEDQSAMEGEAFSFTIPAGTFSDEETATLLLSATLSDGTDLPAWLSFDTGVFSGTPGAGDSDITVRVVAEDEGGLTVSDEFMITVAPINNTAPVVDQGIADQTIEGYEPFSFTVPADAFADAEDALILSATDVPSFVTFDSGTGTFSGEAAINVDEGTYTITVTATEDNADQQSVSTTFDLEIVPVLSTDELPNEIVIYPNPAHDYVTTRIDNSDQGVYEVHILDQSGRILHSESVIKNTSLLEYQIDLSTYDKGLYILRINSGDKTYTYRISRS